MTDVAAAIAKITYAQSVHQEWVDWFDAGSKCSCTLTGEQHAHIAGGREHHAEIVEEYENVLECLRLLERDTI